MTIDKFVTEYKDIPYALFLRVYIIAVQKYKVKKKTYICSYGHEIYMRKRDGTYMYLYYKNHREAEGYLHTLRIETKPEYYVQFREVLEIIARKASRIEFISCDVAYDVQADLEDVIVIPTDTRRKMNHYETTRYFGKPEQRKQNGYCRIYDKRLELEQNQGIYITHDLSRIEIVYKNSEKILLKDIVKYPPKQNKHYFAAIVTDWRTLKKKQIDRVIDLRDGKEMHTQYLRKEIKKTLTKQHRVDFDGVARLNWEKIIEEPYSLILGMVQ